MLSHEDDAMTSDALKLVYFASIQLCNTSLSYGEIQHTAPPPLPKKNINSS
jgi:hypothetical protein